MRGGGGGGDRKAELARAVAGADVYDLFLEGMAVGGGEGDGGEAKDEEETVTMIAWENEPWA